MFKFLRRVKKNTSSASLPPSPFDDPSSIGNILMDLGRITKDQLYAAVGKQAQFNEALLGALLRDMQMVTADDVAKAMVIQEKMRTGKEAQAQLDVLHAKITEAAKTGMELKGVIEERKQLQRDRGERSALFLLPSPASLKG